MFHYIQVDCPHTGDVRDRSFLGGVEVEEAEHDMVVGDMKQQSTGLFRMYSFYLKVTYLKCGRKFPCEIDTRVRKSYVHAAILVFNLCMLTTCFRLASPWSWINCAAGEGKGGKGNGWMRIEQHG